MPIRIVIADDHGVLRAGLRALLSAEPDLEVIGEAADGKEALDAVVALRPDILLLDVNMPIHNGIEVTQQLARTHPNVRVLILTVHEEDRLLQEALRVGASGYIVKRAVESELLNAIRAVARGELYVHPAMTRALMKDLVPPGGEGFAPVSTLTRRELEVLRLVARGYTSSQVAQELTLSVRTVETHRANLMSKLGVTSRVELVRYAKDCGFMNDY
jgi:two-component system, NarL family, response regulator NreC